MAFKNLTLERQKEDLKRLFPKGTRYRTLNGMVFVDIDSAIKFREFNKHNDKVIPFGEWEDEKIVCLRCGMILIG